MKRAVFFDRDGIVVKPVFGEAPTSAGEVELIPEIIPVIKRAKELGYLVFIASNQPDIALGIIDEEEKNRLEERFTEILSEVGLSFDKIYYCHHNKTGINRKYVKNCDCQKPKPGLLIQGGEEFNLDMKSSYMIGDRASDIKAGKDAGVKTILYDPHNTQSEYLKLHNVVPDFYIENLSELSVIL